MTNRTSMGTIALRMLAGDTAAGSLVDMKVEVCMRDSDFQVLSVTNPDTGQKQPIPTNAKVNFIAQRYREIVDAEGTPTGCFEFYVTGAAPGGLARLFLDGADIFYVKVESRLS